VEGALGDIPRSLGQMGAGYPNEIAVRGYQPRHPLELTRRMQRLSPLDVATTSHLSPLTPTSVRKKMQLLQFLLARQLTGIPSAAQSLH
jgi:hypothetical protein